MLETPGRTSPFVVLSSNKCQSTGSTAGVAFYSPVETRSRPAERESTIKVGVFLFFFFNKAQNAESTRSIFAKFHIHEHSESNLSSPESTGVTDTIVSEADCALG